MSMSKKSKTTLITASILFLTLLGTLFLKPAAALAGNCRSYPYHFETESYIYGRILRTYWRTYWRTYCQRSDGRWVKVREGVSWRWRARPVP